MSPLSPGSGSAPTAEQAVDHLRALDPGAGDDLLAAEGATLVLGWSEAHRSYHTLQHLGEVLAALSVLCTGPALQVGRAAAWYHDLAYDPRALAGSNEHRSASLARDHLHRLGVDDPVVDAVEALVLMTVTHDAGAHPAPSGTAYLPSAMDAFHDADLWILAAPPARYAEYAAQVRQEYAHVPGPVFAAGRAAVMAPLVERDEVYRTAHARQEWTAAARRNVGSELARLRAAGGDPG